MDVPESLRVVIQTYRIDISRGLTFVEIPLESLADYFQTILDYIDKLKEETGNDT